MRTGHVLDRGGAPQRYRDDQQAQGDEVLGVGWESHPDQEEAFQGVAGQPDGEALHLVAGAADIELPKAKIFCRYHPWRCDRSHHSTSLGRILVSTGVDDDGDCDEDDDNDGDDDDDDADDDDDDDDDDRLR